MAAIKVIFPVLTGDSVSTEIEWMLTGFVSPYDRRDRFSVDDVEFGDTLTGIATETRATFESDFYTWVESYGIDRARLERLREEAIELAREKVTGEYESAADHAYDSRRDAELEGRQ